MYGFEIRDIALTEPLVDIVDSKSIVPNSALIREIDNINESEDLSFDSPFHLQWMIISMHLSLISILNLVLAIRVGFQLVI